MISHQTFSIKNERFNGSGFNIASFQSGNIICNRAWEGALFRREYFRDWISLLSDRRCVFYDQVGKATDGSTCVCSPASWIFTVFECGMNIGFALRHANRPLYRLCIYGTVTVGLWLALVMKGVLCFNNGQHRASNSSGRVKTRNIYFVWPVSNRIGTMYWCIHILCIH